MMVGRLKYYKDRNNGKLPAQLIVYRDGVGEVCLPFSYCDYVS